MRGDGTSGRCTTYVVAWGVVEIGSKIVWGAWSGGSVFEPFGCGLLFRMLGFGEYLPDVLPGFGKYSLDWLLFVTSFGFDFVCVDRSNRTFLVVVAISGSVGVMCDDIVCAA